MSDSNLTQDAFLEQWNIRKPSVSGSNGVVATQHYLASRIGADVLRRGGNAIDASIAAGLALGVVEPWMSGIGGGGFMTIYLADRDKVNVVEFGMRAPLDAGPDDYPLTGRATGASSFNWPEVLGNVNVHGPLSIAVPGHIKGMALALERFGTWDWKDVIEPACRIAEVGLPMNWYATQII
ncbi:MAG: gamma-glutamyltransferase, partial [Gammaproteobacteria bacterium]|nr:gamma-glutamyltransferase [Gammaproteobacteria bacterium]